MELIFPALIAPLFLYVLSFSVVQADGFPDDVRQALEKSRLNALSLDWKQQTRAALSASRLENSIGLKYGDVFTTRRNIPLEPVKRPSVYESLQAFRFYY